MLKRGGWLLFVLMLGFTAQDMGWISFRSEESPAFSVLKRPNVAIQVVGLGGNLDGIHQINDAQDLIGVIVLANVFFPDYLQEKLLRQDSSLSGKSLQFQVVEGTICGLELSWMPAALRITLGIPLRVDHMSEDDWDDLPGTGPSLTQRIKAYRQKNGEFASINELMLVKGIGSKRIMKWTPFFNQN